MTQWYRLPAVDHAYMDELSVAARYIDNTLTYEEREAFETHMVDCQDCTDRILLAWIFHARMPAKQPGPAKSAVKLTPWQLLLLFVVAALMLLAIPALLIPILLR
jgi:Putative zinc-finger